MDRTTPESAEGTAAGGMAEQAGLEPAAMPAKTHATPTVPYICLARIALGHPSVQDEPLLTGHGLY